MVDHRRRALAISLALGAGALLIVPAYNASLADPAVLAQPGYVGPACQYPIQVFPPPICPYVVAGESPATVLLALLLIPVLLAVSSRSAHYGAGILAALWSVVQVLAPFVAAFPSVSGSRSVPSPFRRDAGCGLVLCGLDHTIFHLVQFVFLAAIALLVFRGLTISRSNRPRA